MRKFKRVGPPPGWPENQDKWNTQWVELLQTTPGAHFSWYQHNGQTARDIALPYLRGQTLEHCSFCDGTFLGCVSPETVEHFRPKCADKFPMHAYSWENLYYCCAQCQLDKGEKWDEGLLAPDAEGYTFERYFEFDFTTGELRPSSTAENVDLQRAKTTLTIYALDSIARRRWRRLTLKHWNDTKPETRNLDEWPYRDYIEFATMTVVEQ